MAYKYKQRAKSIQAKGTLKAISRSAPHKEWLGMPAYYIYTLFVDDQEYSYLSAEKQLPMAVDSYVCFRYRNTSKGNFIDKNSLGVAIDPAEYMRNMQEGD